MSSQATLNVSQQTVFSLPCSKILSRQEAKSKLQKLTPETEEHSKLQSALIKTNSIEEIILRDGPYRVNTASEECALLGGFGASEHIAIGAEVELKGLPKGKETPLLVKGGTKILFEHIVALAGDFYGVFGEPISLLGGTDEEKTARFINAFKTLAEAENDEIKGVLDEIGKECQAVNESGTPHHCYSCEMMNNNNTIKNIKKDINQLLIDNSDHFFNDAKEAYRIGHAYALQVARMAGKVNDIEKLKEAYALDAFACHFLTDEFASGHVRNQRGELEHFLESLIKLLPLNICPSAKQLAGLLTAAQHEKDGNEGLNVTNGKGEKWRAYGDGCFFTPKNEVNKGKAIEAIRASVNEVYVAYVNHEYVLESKMISYIPEATPFPYNPYPLYTLEKGPISQETVPLKAVSQASQALLDIEETNTQPLLEFYSEIDKACSTELSQETHLFFYKGSQKIEIKSLAEFIRKGIPLALTYLPENYIDGFIKGWLPFLNVKSPIILTKVILPPWERLTGHVWHMIGVASHHQVKTGFKEQDGQLKEMAETGMSIWKNTKAILDEIEVVKDQLNEVIWRQLFDELRVHISSINAVAHETELHQMPIYPEKSKENLYVARIHISTLFTHGTTNGKSLLQEYQLRLGSNKSQPMDKLEVKLTVTKWFRKMLDYQIQAFSLWSSFIISTKDPLEKELPRLVSDFNTGIFKQIMNNRDHIDEHLICDSIDYIDLQITKCKTKLAFSFLAAPKDGRLT